MALSASDIAVSSSQYRGDPGLGGGSFGAFEIDSRPIQQLAYYTYLYNRSEYDQKQKDTDAKIKELAKLADIRLNDLRGKDKEQATKEFTQLLMDAGEFARKTPKTQQEKIEQQLQWQEKNLKFRNNFDSGKARSVAYMKRLNVIQENKKSLDAKTLAEEIKQLDEEFDRTDIATPISGETNFPLATIDVPAPTGMEVETFKIGDNENVIVKANIYNPALNAPKASAVVLGISKLYPKKGTPEYESLSDLEKDQADIQGTIESGAKIWADSAKYFNEVLQSKDTQGNLIYYKDGVFNEEKFKIDFGSNPVIMRPFNALKALNEYSQKKKAEVASGLFTDRGFKYQVPTNISADDFNAGIVDFNSPISADKLIQAGMYAKYAGDKFGKTIQETDNLLQAQQQATTRRGQDLDYKVAWKNAETARMNATEKTGVGSAIQTPAILFGQHIDRVKNKIAQTGKEFIVPYSGTDKETRAAVGLEEGEKIRYNVDGSFQIIDATNKIIKVGTVEELKQGFIDAVKNGINEAGVQTEGFQNEAEKAFDGIWRTRSGKTIWENWNKPAAEVTEQTKTTYKLGDKTYSIDQVQKAAKQSGMSVQDYIKTVGLQ